MNHLATAVICLATAVICLATTLTAQNLRVPSQHKTIAAALAAAQSGDTILVAAGTYKERLTWPAVDGIRLIGEEGAQKTILDGQKGGRVLFMSSGSITRKTLIQGFTITGGQLKTTRNYGAGIHIAAGSPTLRNNRITGNQLDGPNWNYGAGIYINGAGSNPRLEHNTFDNNEAINGSWNYGAGIYVGGGAAPEIVGNVVRKNKNASPANQSGNRGHGAGIYVGGPALVASNLVVENQNNVTAWNYGAGIKVASRSGTARILNNTVAGNVCSGGTWTYGGGVHFDSASNVDILGNVVVQNTVRNSNFVSGGGVYRSSSTGSGKVTLDYNDVWSNTGGEYSNVAKGANDIAKDPKFVSATDYHLQPGSPCVDAIPAAHLPPAVAVDVDRDPRRIDGNLDGLKGNGARLDMGGDEFTDVGLALSGVPKLGTLVRFNVTSVNRAQFLFALDLATGNLFLEPTGNLLLGPTLIPLVGGVTPAALPLPLPNDNRLLGLTTYQQSMLLPLTRPGTSRFSNLLAMTIH